MPTVVQHWQDHRGMTTSRCPRCGTQFVHWMNEDLDEDGNLLCHCDEATCQTHDFKMTLDNGVVGGFRLTCRDCGFDPSKV